MEDFMKITFLGTSHGVPAADRHCSCAMIEVGENVYIFDAGAPVVEGILKSGHAMDDLKAVFITHVHSDHTGNLFSLANLCSWFFRTTNVNFYIPEQRLWDGLLAYNKGTSDAPFASERLHDIVFDEDFVYDDGVLRVTPIPTKHLFKMNHPAYGFVIEGDGKRVLITGDMSQGLDYDDFPTVTFEEHFDIVVSELAHFDIEQMPFLDKILCDKLIFWHINKTDTKFPKIRALQGTLPYDVLIVDDEDVLEV